jgi:hypothetical protein
MVQFPSRSVTTHMAIYALKKTHMAISYGTVWDRVGFDFTRNKENKPAKRFCRSRRKKRRKELHAAESHKQPAFRVYTLTHGPKQSL